MSARSWLTHVFRFGVGGLDLRHAVDAVPEERLTRMKNVQAVVRGGVTARPGQTAVLSSPVNGTIVHSLIRFEDPQNQTWTRVAGVDTGIYLGLSSMPLLDTGYSGGRLSFVPYRPPQASETWLYVGDSARMRKIRRDGLHLPIGITAPTSAVAASLMPQLTTPIEACESGWTARTGTATGAGSHAAGFDGNAFTLTTTPGASAGYAWADKTLPAAVDLTRVGTGGDQVDAEDEDLIHLALKVDYPDRLAEIKVYLVTGSSFTAGASGPPGLAGTTNADAFVASFRPSDLTGTISQTETMTDAADARVTRTARNAKLDPYEDERDSLTYARESDEDARLVSPTLVTGQSQWTEYGVIGRPLRRSDFVRIGSPDGSWSTIVGVVLSVTTVGTTAVQVSIDDLYLHGGAGPDASESGFSSYDWRYTHYDPRVGAESNPSPISVTTLDPLRRSVFLDPNGTGDLEMRQRFYRRGGTLPDAWYYVGENTADGAGFVDTLTDGEAEAGGEAPDDHDLPVTTTDRDGTTVRGVPLPALWGPVAGLYLVGCGDPYRKGHLYWCAPGEPDHWPPDNNLEVCAPSEELLNGGMYNTQAFVFSRERLFFLYPHLAGDTGTTLTATPTPAGHGLAGRWAFAVGAEIYYVSRDGIYATAGGVERCLTDEQLGPLFHRSVTVRDLLPSATLGGYGEGGYGLGGYGTLGNTQIASPPSIDWAAEDYLSLEVFENDLWFTYLDTTGRIQTLVYSLLDQEWRWYLFAKPPRAISVERFGQESRLLIGSTNGQIYEHTGTSDDGEAIDCLVRTRVDPQGNPRADKIYGDLAIEADPQHTVLSIRTYLGGEERFNTASQIIPPTVDPGAVLSSIVSPTGRSNSRHDHFAGGILARGVAVEVVWISGAYRPIVYSALVSYLQDPDLTETRVTDWDDAGMAGLKLVKSAVLEVDTQGKAKTFILEADGIAQSTHAITTTGRRQVELSFVPFEGRLLRIRPTGTDPIHLYGIAWIAEPLPLSLTRWESRPLDLGQFGWFVHFDSYVTLRSTGVVTFTLTLDGVEETYSIPSTGGTTLKVYVPFRAKKCRLASYRLTATDPFLLYREETFVRIYPWGANSPVVLHPFGGENLDPTPTRTAPGAIQTSGI